ncbi:uncharacterized protein LOC120430882 [Culex pipiens pallens]|uniref:uncharacterized protein LOC120430882 n=1 Tax=Culex pipiens pallens TaxID=42434 RepID=UPI0022AA5C73|nr:uncharacterized protein LOC120430882 [Culex pipiens pallens]
MTVKNCHLFVSFVYKLSPLQYFSSLRYFFFFTCGTDPRNNLPRNPPAICARSPVRICAPTQKFRTRDLHCNSFVENGLEDKEDEDVCRFCLKADGGVALVEFFPGGSGSVADCLGVEISSWDMVTKICGDCVGGVKELAEFRAEFSPTAVPVMLEDVTDSSDSYSIGSENGEGGEGFESDSSTTDNGEKRRGKAEGHGTVAAVDWK